MKMTNNHSKTNSTDNYGYVYVLSNEYMPGLVKIGFTSAKEAEQRAKELYTTGVPVPFTVEFACRVKHSKELEVALHDAFSDKRINQNREFFKMHPSQVVAILKYLETLTKSCEDRVDDATTEFNNLMDKGLTTEDTSARKYARKPNLNFIEMGLKIGDTIVYVDDPNITATIKSERKVEYNNIEYSLSRLTNDLRGKSSDYGVQPTLWWTYNGNRLDEYYNQTYSQYND